MSKVNTTLTLSYQQEGFADWQESFAFLDGKLFFLPGPGRSVPEEITKEFLARCEFPRYVQLRKIASFFPDGEGAVGV